MKVQGLITLLLIVLITGCTTTKVSQLPSIYEPADKSSDISKIVVESKLRYKMVVVDTRIHNGENNASILSTKEVFKNFGVYLKNKGVVVYLKSKQRRYIKSIQRHLNEDLYYAYNLDNTKKWVSNIFSKPTLPL